MTRIDPPPSLDIPDATEVVDLDVGIDRVAGSMERLAAWMYATAQEVERMANGMKGDIDD